MRSVYRRSEDVNLTSDNWMQSSIISSSADSAVSGHIEDILPGLIIGRSLLFIILSVLIVLCFYRGLAIAKQCWEVYRVMEKS